MQNILDLARDGVLTLENMCIWFLVKNSKGYLSPESEKKISLELLEKLKHLSNGKIYENSSYNYEVRVEIVKTTETYIHQAEEIDFDSESLSLLTSRIKNKKTIKVDIPLDNSENLDWLWQKHIRNNISASHIAMEFETSERLWEDHIGISKFLSSQGILKNQISSQENEIKEIRDNLQLSQRENSQLSEKLKERETTLKKIEQMASSLDFLPKSVNTGYMFYNRQFM